MEKRRRHIARALFALMFPMYVMAADVTGSADPPDMKRYDGSVIIGFHAPKFDDFLLPLGPPTVESPAAYSKSQQIAGMVGRYTYVAPAGRGPAELFGNYKSEFQRLDLETLYEKASTDHGWFGPTLQPEADADGIKQILAYNEAEERVLVAKTKSATPTYYYLFVTSYKDGMIPDRLKNQVSVGRALAELIVVAPQAMERKMAFVSADDMSRALATAGRIALYGIYFDTDKDLVRADSQPALQEIAKLLKSQQTLHLHVVGHSDNQGTSDHNLDLSRRRAASVVHELIAHYAVPDSRLDSFGAGWYAPVVSNGSDDGRAKNRRVELVQW